MQQGRPPGSGRSPGERDRSPPPEGLGPLAAPLLALPPGQRETVVEIDLCGRTERECARSWGVSAAEVRRVHGEALARLRAALRDDGSGELADP